MAKRKNRALPNAPILENWGGDWIFSNAKAWEFFVRHFEAADDAWQAGDAETAKEICERIVAKCPEYFAAWGTLGEIAMGQGDFIQAMKCFETILDIGFAGIPRTFKYGRDKISWDFTGNRQFLLAWENLGICHLRQSFDLLERLHDTNPGFRGIAKLLSELEPIAYPPEYFGELKFANWQALIRESD
jgi:tetratricopeptide (TPR) repeat protein